MTANLPAPASPSTVLITDWRSTRGLRTALTWLLPCNAVAAVALAFAGQNQRDVVGRYNNGNETFNAAKQADDLFGTVSLIFLVLLAATGVVFINWMWRSAHNNDALGRIRPRYSPGWSIGGWFIPFVNLVIPVRVMHDLWQGSDLETSGHTDWRRLRRSPLVGWWWGCYIAGGLLAARYAGMVFIVAAAVLAILLVRQVTERQEVARQASRAIAPGWYADPMGRFDHRYWNGSAWTVHVSRGGEQAVDQLA